MKDVYLTPKDIEEFNSRIVKPQRSEPPADTLLHPPLTNDELRKSSLRYMDGNPKIVVY